APLDVAVLVQPPRTPELARDRAILRQSIALQVETGLVVDEAPVYPGKAGQGRSLTAATGLQQADMHPGRGPTPSHRHPREPPTQSSRKGTGQPPIPDEALYRRPCRLSMLFRPHFAGANVLHHLATPCLTARKCL